MINKNVEKIFNEEALILINSKNDDYANPTDFYANFRLSEQAGIPMFIGIHVRLLDKISRLNSFISRFYRTGEITANHESIEVVSPISPFLSMTHPVCTMNSNKRTIPSMLCALTFMSPA